MTTRKAGTSLLVAGFLVLVCALPGAAVTNTVTSNSNPSQLGEYVTFTSTVTGIAPSGNVRFTINGGAPSAWIPLVAQNANVSTATFVASGLILGNNSVVAQYAGNLGNLSSPTFLQSVVNTRVTTTTTTLTASPDPSTQGQSVTFTATLAGALNPSGVVNFYSRDGAGLLTLMGSTPASPTGNLSTASFATSSLPVGSTTVFANFVADAPLRMSSGNRSVTVNALVPSPTSSSLTVSPTSAMVGDTVTFTAVVTSGGGTPTGTVLFTIAGSPSGPFTLTNGSVAVPSSFLTAGNFSASYVYTPSGNFQASVSSTRFFLITKAPTTTNLGSSLDPAASGASVTFTASVTSGFAGTPGGTMNFLADGSPLCTSVAMSLGSAQCTTSALATGIRQIQANYSGDGTYAASSDVYFQTISAPAAAVTVTSNANPSQLSQFVTFTSSVAGINPSGSVVFTLDGGFSTPPIPLTSVSGNLSTATWVASTLTLGNHSISSAYTGNLGNFSSPVFQQTVLNTRTLATSTSIVAAPNPGTQGQNVTFTATLIGAGAAGTVTFYSEDSQGLLTALASFGNVSIANYSTSSLPLGTTRVFANYVSNPPYRMSAGNVSVSVLAPPEMNVTGNGNSIADGDASPDPSDHTDFGSATFGVTTVTRTFTIANTGAGPLRLTGIPAVAISGPQASDFSVTAPPATPIAALGSTTFQVTFTPGGLGARTATLSINNNDGDENPYNFAVQGTGLSPCPAITLSSLGNGTIGVPYVGSVSASGGAGPYAYSLTSGTLPTSLLLNSPTAGDLTGTPTATGTFTFQITATDANTCTGSQSYTVHVGSPVSAGDLVIREFRTRGPASAADEYIVLHNRTTSPITVAATDGSSGFAVASSDGNVVFTIANGTVIPARGFFLGVNTAGYSLGGASDASWTTDIADGLGLGLFRTSNPGNFGVPTSLDAVGFSGGSAPYIEGAGLTSLGAVGGEYAWIRKGLVNVPQDTNGNSTDFLLVSTNGGVYNTVQSVLGAPSPTNGNTRDVYDSLTVSLIEPSLNVNAGPNRVRILAGGDRLEFRRRITNNSASPIASLRLHFMDLTTFQSPGYSPGTSQADLRPNTSATVSIVPTTSTGVTSVSGLTLITPPAQSMGGGLNSILTIPGGLAPGASVDINIALFVTRVGGYRFFATIEGQ
ncbi:MAG: Ig-like domain repeat protein [Vicinamibacteria bacterium]|nr:Ig-like domain repeat protein [Vicinamibacteria bacterium]